MSDADGVQARHWSFAVGALGAVALVLGLGGDRFVPIPGAGGWLFVGLGVAYLATAGVAWTVLDGEGATHPVARSILPAVLTPAVTLVAFADGDVAELLGSFGPVHLALAALFAAITAGFALGVATAPRRQWAVVGTLAVAAVPMVALGASGLAADRPEDSDLIVLVGALVVLAAVVPAIPLYVVGRSVRGTLGDAEPSPYPPLVGAAMPFVLVLAAAAAAPWFVTGPVFGPLLVIVPALALVAIGAQAVRVRARSA